MEKESSVHYPGLKVACGIRDTCIIQDTKGLYMITKDKQKTSEDSTNARRRICEYVEYIPREKSKVI